MLQQLYFEFAPFIIFLPAILAVLNYKRYPPALQYITCYLLVAVLSQLTSYVLWKQSKNNMPILHVYIIIEYLLLLRFYYAILGNYLHKAIFMVLLVVPPLFFIADSLFLESIYTYNTFARSVECLAIIFLAMSWYVKLVSKETDDEAIQRSIKYINSALLIYFSGSVMLFTFANTISKLALKYTLLIWSLHTLLAVVLYVLIAIGLWKYRKQ